MAKVAEAVSAHVNFSGTITHSGLLELLNAKAAYGRREEIGFGADQRRSTIRQRADAAWFLKQRLLYRIPYHEWAEAERRRGDARDALLEAYALRWDEVKQCIASGSCCPPWAPRKYRAAAMRAFGQGSISGAIRGVACPDGASPHPVPASAS